MAFYNVYREVVGSLINLRLLESKPGLAMDATSDFDSTLNNGCWFIPHK